MVGYAYAGTHRPRAAYRWATEVAVYVAPAHQRGGIGRDLYTALVERLVGRGYQVACAGITLPNPASVALHHALGFEPVGVSRRIGWRAGAWRDLAWWQRDRSRSARSLPPNPPCPAPDSPDQPA